MDNSIISKSAAEQTEPTERKYWQDRPGTAPIKSEYVLWEKMRGGVKLKDNDDDAAEGRTDSRDSQHVVPQRSAQVEQQDEGRVPVTTLGEPEAIAAVPLSEGGESQQPEAKKVRLSGAQKKHLARQKKEEQWLAKKAAKAAGVKDGDDAADGVEQGGGRKRGKGQNKGRTFDHQAGTGEVKLCTYTGKGENCTRQNCKWSHDIAAFFAERQPDIRQGLPTSSDDLTPLSLEHTCPSYASLGQCQFGFRCRFGISHMRHVGEGQGFQGSGWELVVDQAKIDEHKRALGDSFINASDKGEFNLVQMEQIKAIRKGVSPLADAYLESIGEPNDFKAREAAKSGNGKRKRNGQASEAPASKTSSEEQSAPAMASAPEAGEAAMPADAVPSAVAPAESSSATTDAPQSSASAMDVDSQPARSFVPDLARVRAVEKKRLDWRGKLYLAPLTTVGNLPFRRLCVDYGNDISCSEMGLAQEFLNGNSNEWSLVRRHPSEQTFGVQIAGSKPSVLVPAAEQIVKHCDIDFLDVNCGCPIDLVFNKGAGSALMQHAGKLGKALAGMSQVLGEIPLTIKIRTGVQQGNPVAHKIIPRFQKIWGLSAMTIHGRSRQQRYKNKADYAYIAECAKVLRETASDEGLAPIPIFGNGDAYDYRTYYENMESTGVDGIMIARGALIKPWIFTEIKERRDWDISSRERLDMIGKLVDYGLEHWGSDQMGVNHVRRFVCESLSFTHRYVPIGLLERFPISMNDRPMPYKGRDELETLLASDQAADWVKITDMFLGPAPDDWHFLAKHKASTADTEVQG